MFAGVLSPMPREFRNVEPRGRLGVDHHHDRGNNHPMSDNNPTTPPTPQYTAAAAAVIRAITLLGATPGAAVALARVAAAFTALAKAMRSDATENVAAVTAAIDACGGGGTAAELADNADMSASVVFSICQTAIEYSLLAAAYAAPAATAAPAGKPTTTTEPSNSSN